MIPVFIFVIDFQNETVLVKQEVIGVYKKMLKHVYKTRNCICCRFQGMAIFIHILILHVKVVKLPQQHANTTVRWL